MKKDFTKENFTAYIEGLKKEVVDTEEIKSPALYEKLLIEGTEFKLNPEEKKQLWKQKITALVNLKHKNPKMSSYEILRNLNTIISTWDSTTQEDASDKLYKEAYKDLYKTGHLYLPSLVTSKTTRAILENLAPHGTSQSKFTASKHMLQNLLIYESTRIELQLLNSTLRELDINIEKPTPELLDTVYDKFENKRDSLKAQLDSILEESINAYHTIAKYISKSEKNRNAAAS